MVVFDFVPGSNPYLEFRPDPMSTLTTQTRHPKLTVTLYCLKQMVSLLLGHGGSPLDNQSERGKTALVCAARSGHTEVVKLLLEYGADAMLDPREGATALTAARQLNHQGCVTLLEVRIGLGLEVRK